MNATCPTGSRRSPLKQAVTFSEYSELVYYQSPCDYDKSTMWYSSDDRLRFRQTMIDDVRKASHEIDALPPFLQSSDDIDDMIAHRRKQKLACECLGIEIFLSNGVARYAEQARRAHIAAVLSEQWMQKQNGICDTGRLSRISQIRSQATVEKAWKLAAGCAALQM